MRLATKALVRVVRAWRACGPCSSCAALWLSPAITFCSSRARPRGPRRPTDPDPRKQVFVPNANKGGRPSARQQAVAARPKNKGGRPASRPETIARQQREADAASRAVLGLVPLPPPPPKPPAKKGAKPGQKNNKWSDAAKATAVERHRNRGGSFADTVSHLQRHDADVYAPSTGRAGLSVVSLIKWCNAAQEAKAAAAAAGAPSAWNLPRNGGLREGAGRSSVVEMATLEMMKAAVTKVLATRACLFTAATVYPLLLAIFIHHQGVLQLAGVAPPAPGSLGIPRARTFCMSKRWVQRFLRHYCKFTFITTTGNANKYLGAGCPLPVSRPMTGITRMAATLLLYAASSLLCPPRK